MKAEEEEEEGRAEERKGEEESDKGEIILKTYRKVVAMEIRARTSAARPGRHSGEGAELSYGEGSASLRRERQQRHAAECIP